MNRKEVFCALGILLALLVVGLAIVAKYNNLYTQFGFIVVMILALVALTVYHRKDNEYYCMKCGLKVKVGLIPDLECPELENGDRIFKCKRCKRKVNFRKLEKN